jgi:hypothetical protein
MIDAPKVVSPDVAIQAISSTVSFEFPMRATIGQQRRSSCPQLFLVLGSLNVLVDKCCYYLYG